MNTNPFKVGDKVVKQPDGILVWTVERTTVADDGTPICHLRFGFASNDVWANFLRLATESEKSDCSMNPV